MSDYPEKYDTDVTVEKVGTDASPENDSVELETGRFHRLKVLSQKLGIETNGIEVSLHFANNILFIDHNIVMFKFNQKNFFFFIFTLSAYPRGCSNRQTSLAQW